MQENSGLEDSSHVASSAATTIDLCMLSGLRVHAGGSHAYSHQFQASGARILWEGSTHMMPLNIQNAVLPAAPDWHQWSFTMASAIRRARPSGSGGQAQCPLQAAERTCSSHAPSMPQERQHRDEDDYASVLESIVLQLHDSRQKSDGH